LAAALNHVVDRIREVVSEDTNTLSMAKREWSTQKLFAIDKDAVSVRLSKAYLSMLGDGSTHVWKMDSIRSSIWPQVLRTTIQDEAFDVVVTNPPFGTKLKVPPQVGREEGYVLSHRWECKDGRWVPTEEYVSRDLGLIFLERSLRLLRPGGRLAIVLPDTYLFSDSYGWLMQWLGHFTITHSINIPIEAFVSRPVVKSSSRAG
jgi:type I restriction enzyme M protein